MLLLAGCNRPVKHSDIIQADTMVSIIPQEDTITLSALFSRCEIVKLNDIADDYEEEIENDPYASIGQRVRAR